MKFKNYIETESGIKDTSASPGTAGQLLSSTVAGTSWIDQNTISSGTSETIDIQVKNIASADGGIDLVKGDPVYIYGSVGASPRLYIDLADADSTATNNLGDSKMPCVALLDQDLSPNGEGTATVVGKLRNLITNPIDGNVPNENDTVYVKSGGGLTLTKPAGSTNLIQNVGQVGRVSTSADGNIVVAALLRTNDVPNLPEGRLFVGTSANTSLVSDVVYVDDTNDRVGIGTTNPNAKLEVVGTTGVIIDSGSSNAAKLTLIGDGSSYGGGGTIDIIGGAVDYMSYNLNLKRSPNTLEAFNRYWQGNVKWEWDGNIGGTVAQPYTSYEFKTQGSSQMVIWNNNVGIGTTSPGEKLTVAGNISVTSPNSFLVKNGDSNHGLKYGYNTFASNPTDGPILYGYDAGGLGTKRNSENIALYWNYLGNVGIGTTSLTSISSTSATLSLGATSATTSGGIAFQVDGGIVKAYNYVGTGYLYNQTVSGIGQIFFGAGSERMRIHNTTGNIGIGTTNPQAKLHVSNGALRTWSPSSGTSAIFESTVSSRNFVTLTAANEAELWFGNASTQTLGRIRYEMANNNMEFWTNSVERMAINSIGNVGINGAPSTTTSTRLKVHGTIASAGGSGFQIENSYGSPRLSDFYGSFTTSVSLYVGSPYSTLPCYASAFNVTSDYRLKENEAPLTKASSRIKKLKPIRFNYINSENTVDGFLAHEVAEVIPEAVTGEKDAVREDGSDELQGLDLSKIVPLLTAALQEAISKIEQLETRIQTLENK